MSRLARAAALVVVPVLALGALPAPAGHAAPQRGQAEGAAAVGYLTRNLDDGLLTYRPYESSGRGYTSYDASIDTALALDAIGGHDAEVTAIADAISAHLTDYTDYSYVERGYTYAGRSAGRTANAIIVMQAAGQDPTAHPDGDLVARLESMLVPVPDGVGERIKDVSTRDGRDRPSGNHADLVGQTLALTALRQAGSSHAAAVAAHLLDRQCFYAGNFDFLDGPECSRFPGDADVNATAYAAIAIAPLYADEGTTTDAAVALSKVVSFLDDVQLADGGFPDRPDVDPDFRIGSNAASTGLAVTALRRIATIPRFERYAAPLAARGAAWLRAHQLVNVGPCKPYAGYALGAVDRDGTVSGRITAATEGSYVDSTARSAEALLSAPAAAGTLRTNVSGRYVAPGTTQKITVLNAAPGSAVCSSADRVQSFSSIEGVARFRVPVPTRAGTTTYTFTDGDGSTASTTITSLPAKTLDVRLRTSVARGGTQRVLVTGLAPREPVSIRIDGTVVQHRQATASGVLDTQLVVRAATGTRTLTVVGALANRNGSKKFTVTS